MRRALIVLAFVSTVVSPAIAFAQAEVMPSPATATPTNPDDKVRCKRFTETGSLAKVRKECHTEGEWRALGEAARRDAANRSNTSSAPGMLPQ